MKANLQDLRLRSVYDYDGFVLAADVSPDRVFKLNDGGMIVQDKEGHLFNVHPAIDSRFNHTTRKQEQMERSYCVRWQILGYLLPREQDMPEDLKDILKEALEG